MSIAFRPIQMTDEYEYVHILLLVLHIFCICFDVFVAISLIPFPLQLFLFLPSALALFCFIHPNMYLSISFAHASSLSLHPIHIVHICSFKMILYIFLLHEAMRNVRCVWFTICFSYSSRMPLRFAYSIRCWWWCCCCLLLLLLLFLAGPIRIHFVRYAARRCCCIPANKCLVDPNLIFPISNNIHSLPLFSSVRQH